MAIETELKLSLPSRSAAKLAAHPMLAGIKPLRQRLLNTYYDTPDLRLQRERIAVRYRKKGWQWLLTVKCAAPSAGGLARRNEWEAPGLPGEFDFSHVDDKKMRRRLESMRDELIPAFTTDFTRNTWLLKPEPGILIELALDRGQIEAKGRHELICEIELELFEGDAGALFTAALALQAKLPLHPESASKAERGYRLLTDAPLQAIKALPVAIDEQTTSIAAFRTIALACLNHLQSNEKGIHSTDDPEFVHQARVAIRRLRSAIRIWKPLLPADFVACFDPLWRTLANQLGDTRNWDVFVTETLPPLAGEFPDHPEIMHLSRHALKHAASNRKNARAALKSPAYSHLLLAFTAALLALLETTETPLKAHARRCLSKRAKQVFKFNKTRQGVDAAGRHHLRVAIKRLRYALEFFAPLFPGARLQHYHQATIDLQDLLGRMNDLVVATQLTERMLPGSKSDLIRAWLGRQGEELLPDLSKKLHRFLQQKMPWIHFRNAHETCGE